ncbi:hypothetical protein [Mucilaginibacter psychrotolerans]|uniref:Uncharacterized protein n=1 Tax=Mucilaginibacter psychrotolerans TaxID=1524096 RepID=A0A4Y8S5C2_9SPHI|nr:hypothetical protein [Mucilaginibacter psychrotolerans]TFF33936.1 hypothetical protein E2R66_23955 [Mucilaginibacter psychrotolerans]
MLNYFTIVTIPELICFITAAVCLYNDKSPAWKWLVFYLFWVCLTEIGGIYLRARYGTNNWIYNILFLFEIATIMIMFRAVLNPYRNSNKLISVAAIVLYSVYLINTFAKKDSFFQHYSNTGIALAIVAALLSFYFFYWFLNDDAYVPLFSSASFWWVSGTLLFYFGTTVIRVFYDYLSGVIPELTIYYIYRAVNITLYVCWSYSFICRRLRNPISRTL